MRFSKHKEYDKIITEYVCTRELGQKIRIGQEFGEQKDFTIAWIEKPDYMFVWSFKEWVKAPLRVYKDEIKRMYSNLKYTYWICGNKPPESPASVRVMMR